MATYLITLTEQIAEIDRELAVRLDIYPRRVAAKRMSRCMADLKIATMMSIRESLLRLQRMIGDV